MGDNLRFFSSASPESRHGHGHTSGSYGPEFAGPWGEPGDFAGLAPEDYNAMVESEMERLISADGPTTSWLYSDYYSQPPQGDNYGFTPGTATPPAPLQRQLTVGAENDPLEKEADEVADRVMRNPRDCYLDPPVSPFQPRPVREKISAEMYDEHETDAPAISRMAEPDEKMQSKSLQRNLAGMDDDAKETLGYTHAFEKSDDEEDMGTTTSLYMQRDAKGPGADGGPVSSDLEERIQGVRNSGGEKLPESEREFFESRMGHDFGDVRIHTGSEAAQVSRDVNAKAFTVGRDVVFGEGEYKPGTSEGRRLMAHELTHTVQQGAAGNLRREEKKGAGTDESTGHFSWGRLLMRPDSTSPGMIANVFSLHDAVVSLYEPKNKEEIKNQIRIIQQLNPWIKNPDVVTNLKPVLLPPTAEKKHPESSASSQPFFSEPVFNVNDLPGGELSYQILLAEARIPNQWIRFPKGFALVDYNMSLDYSVTASAGIPLVSLGQTSKDPNSPNKEISDAAQAIGKAAMGNATIAVQTDLQKEAKLKVAQDGMATFISFSPENGFAKFDTGAEVDIEFTERIPVVGDVSISGTLTASIGVTVKFVFLDGEKTERRDQTEMAYSEAAKEAMKGLAEVGAVGLLVTRIGASILVAVAAP